MHFRLSDLTFRRPSHVWDGFSHLSFISIMRLSLDIKGSKNKTTWEVEIRTWSTFSGWRTYVHAFCSITDFSNWNRISQSLLSETHFCFNAKSQTFLLILIIQSVATAVASLPGFQSGRPWLRISDESLLHSVGWEEKKTDTLRWQWDVGLRQLSIYTLLKPKIDLLWFKRQLLIYFLKSVES